MPKIALTFRFCRRHADGRITHFILKGRDGWCLTSLIRAGDKGITPMTVPARRLAAYIFSVRQKTGFTIEARLEPHGGPYSGHHARYWLRSEGVEIVSTPTRAEVEAEWGRPTSHTGEKNND